MFEMEGRWQTLGNHSFLNVRGLHQSCILISAVQINNTKLHSKSKALKGRFCGTDASSKQRELVYFHVHFRCFVGNSGKMLIFLHTCLKRIVLKDFNCACGLDMQF